MQPNNIPMSFVLKFILSTCVFLFSVFTYAQSPAHSAVPGKRGYPPIKNGIYQIINLATGKSAGMENDNSIVQMELANDITQKWLFEEQADGSYKITNLEGGKVLQVNGRKKNPHAIIEQGNWDGNNSQRWYIRFSGKGHIRLLNKNSWCYMETPNGATDDGRVLQQARYANFPYQEWKLKARVN